MKEGYKDTLISKIPSDWVVLPLGIIGDTFNGLTGKTKVDFGQGKPYITYMNIYSNPKLKNNFNDFVQIGEEENQNKVQYGDIFFTTSSETAGEVGFSSVLLDKVDECYLNSFCFGFRMKNFETLLPEYAVYVLRGEKTRKIISVLAQGSTRFNLSKITLLKKLKLALPPLPEQQKIAEILSTVDAKTAIIDQQITETQELKKGFMQRLLTKGIGHTEFKESALGEIPLSWQVVKIGDVLKLGGGRDYKHLGKGKIPVYGTGGVMTYVNEYLYDGESVGIGRKGSIDKPVFLNEKFWTVDTLFYTHSFKSVIPFYIYVVFQSINWRKHSEATGVPSLSRSIIEPLKILRPPISEQTKIVEIFQSLDGKLEILSEKKETYQELKKGLMQQLLTGLVRVKV
jgi:type I restriction enzyme S subunit